MEGDRSSHSKKIKGRKALKGEKTAIEGSESSEWPEKDSTHHQSDLLNSWNTEVGPTVLQLVCCAVQGKKRNDCSGVDSANKTEIINSTVR